MSSSVSIKQSGSRINNARYAKSLLDKLRRRLQGFQLKNNQHQVVGTVQDLSLDPTEAAGYFTLIVLQSRPGGRDRFLSLSSRSLYNIDVPNRSIFTRLSDSEIDQLYKYELRDLSNGGSYSISTPATSVTTVSAETPNIQRQSSTSTATLTPDATVTTSSASAIAPTLNVREAKAPTLDAPGLDVPQLNRPEQEDSNFLPATLPSQATVTDPSASALAPTPDVREASAPTLNAPGLDVPTDITGREDINPLPATLSSQATVTDPSASALAPTPDVREASAPTLDAPGLDVSTDITEREGIDTLPEMPPVPHTVREEVIRLLEEKLDINRNRRKAGEVIIRKEVETRLVEVPVRWEKLVVEQVGAEQKRLAEVDLGQGEILGVDLVAPEDAVHYPTVKGEFLSLEAARSVLETIASTIRHRCKLIKVEIFLRYWDTQRTYLEFTSPRVASHVLDGIAKTLHHRCTQVNIELALDDWDIQPTYQEWFDQHAKP